METSSSLILSAPTFGTLCDGVLFCCDGINHVYIPSRRIETRVARANHSCPSYIAVANVCPCGAVSLDAGRTWETVEISTCLTVWREERQSTVTHIELYEPEAPEVHIPIGKMAIASTVALCMFVANFWTNIPMDKLQYGMLFTVAAPHIVPWLLKLSWFLMCVTPGFVGRLVLTSVVSVDLMLGQMALCLKIWLKALPSRLYTLTTDGLLYAFLMSFFIVLVVGETAVDIWNNRPRVLKANLQGYAFALFVFVTMLVAGIR